MLHRLETTDLQASGPLEHGGDLDAARRRFPDAPAPWIDLSTGINPHAYPFEPPPSAAFARLPGRDDLARLEHAAAQAYGVGSAREIAAAAGAQALIQILPRLMAGRTVGVLSPTYGEHAASWKRAGRDVILCADPDELADCDIGVLVNPNNPDGRRVARDRLSEIARRTRLIVDESFADFEPQASVAPDAGAWAAVVLRSFGKAYGLAGVRLGFVVASADFIARIRAEIGPWAVSGPAIAIGAQALADADWRCSMAARLASETARLDALLTGAGFQIIGGTRLFRLAAHPDAPARADALGRAGVHVRRFAERATWLRFGLPPDDGWPRLEAALSSAGARA